MKLVRGKQCTVTEPFRATPASKQIGDGWLLASFNGLQSTLVTFDKALYQQARKQGYSVVMPRLRSLSWE